VKWWNYSGYNSPTDPEYADITNTLLVSAPYTLAFGQCCDVPQVEETYDREGFIGSIVADTINYYDFANERRYYGLCRAFKELNKDTTRLHLDIATDSTYINFYNNYKNSNIAKFIYVYKLIENEEFELAEDSLEAIADTNRYESYCKAVLTIYLQKIITGDPLSSSDSLELEEIANECPMIGGPAVYEARAILNVDLSDTCLTGGSRIQNLWSTNVLYQIGLSKFDVHPNPASDHVSVINKSNTIIRDAFFVLHDYSGRELKRFPLLGFYTSISLVEFSQGMYLYNIYADKKLIQADKLLIGR
jgi:hypothetical protein